MTRGTVLMEPLGICAFDDPDTPANAPRRESIETRAFAFFD